MIGRQRLDALEAWHWRQVVAEVAPQNLAVDAILDECIRFLTWTRTRNGVSTRTLPRTNAVKWPPGCPRFDGHGGATAGCCADHP
jgi:hypothetical protein